MPNVKLDAVRSGVRLLSGLIKRADRDGNDNGRVTRTEIRNFVSNYGDGGSLDEALNRVFRYAQAKNGGKDSLTFAEINSALGDAMRASARGDTNKSDDLSTAERSKLRVTWQAVVDFAADYQGMSVRDITNPRNPP